MALGVHVCARLPVDRASRPTELAVDQPSTDCKTLSLRFCRSTGPIDRQFKNSVCLSLRLTGPVNRSQPLFCHVACRSTGPVDRQPSKVPNGSFLKSVLILMLPTPISEFLVAKLYPNDLVSIINGVYSLSINRGHWSFIFHKKNIQVSSFLKEKKSLLAFIFKFFHLQEFFSWFPSLLLFFN